MQALYNHTGDLIAYQYQHAIVHPETFVVLGVVIGDCVYNLQAKALGKFLHRKLFNRNGEVMAQKEEESLLLPARLDYRNLLSQAWTIITKIKDHAYPSVVEKNTWSRESLSKYLVADV